MSTDNVLHSMESNIFDINWLFPSLEPVYPAMRTSQSDNTALLSNQGVGFGYGNANVMERSSFANEQPALRAHDLCILATVDIMWPDESFLPANPSYTLDNPQADFYTRNDMHPDIMHVTSASSGSFPHTLYSASDTVYRDTDVGSRQAFLPSSSVPRSLFYLLSDNPEGANNELNPHTVNCQSVQYVDAPGMAPSWAHSSPELGLPSSPPTVGLQPAMFGEFQHPLWSNYTMPLGNAAAVDPPTIRSRTSQAAPQRGFSDRGPVTLAERHNCSWDGCRFSLIGMQDNGIKAHLHKSHGLKPRASRSIPLSENSEVRCRWMDCGKDIKSSQLVKHILATHLRRKEETCKWCSAKLSRRDALKRHKSTCPRR